MKNRSGSESAEPLFFDAKEVAKTFHEIGVDYLEVEDHQIKSRWFKAIHDTDLFLWEDSENHIIKTQLTFLGQIVEWNTIEGVKTGLVVEQEVEDTQKIKASETIVFDPSPQQSSVRTAIEIIKNLALLENDKKSFLLLHLSGEKKPPGLPRNLTTAAPTSERNHGFRVVKSKPKESVDASSKGNSLRGGSPFWNWITKFLGFRKTG